MTPDAATDSELLRRFHRQGDRQALSLLFERHRALAFRVALGVLHAPGDAEDAAQEAFLNLIRYAPRVRSEGSLAGLVARMAMRSAQHIARSAGRRRAHETDAPDAEGVAPDRMLEDLVERDLRRTVRGAVDALDDRYRLPVLLHYYEGLSTREAAEALGITQTAVTTRLSRAVARLRHQMKPAGATLSLSALIPLLTDEAAGAAPAGLVTRLETLAASAVPAAGILGLAGLGGGTVGAKVAAAAVVVAVSLGGIGALHRLPPPPPAGANRVAPGPLESPERWRATADRMKADAGARNSVPPAREGVNTLADARAKPRERGSGGLRPGVILDAARTTPARAAESKSAAPGLRPGVLTDAGSATSSGGHRKRPAVVPARAATPSEGGQHGGVRRRHEGSEHPISYRVQPAAGRLVARAQAATQPPAPTARRWTPEEQRRFGIALLLSLWKETKDTRIFEWLAAADLRTAQRLAATVSPAHRRDAQFGLFGALLQSDPERALALALPQEYRGWALLQGADRLARRRPQRARQLVERGLAAIPKSGERWLAAAAVARAAATYHTIGDPRAPALMAQAEKAVPEILAGAASAEEGADQIRAVAEVLAAADPDAALRMVGLVPDKKKREDLRLRLAPAVAAKDLERGLALLAPEPDPQGGGLDRNWLKCRIVRDLAARDFRRAEALARTIEEPFMRVEALLSLARHAPRERAQALYREALGTPGPVEPFGSQLHVLLTVADKLPPGPERRRACALALDGTAGPGQSRPAARTMAHVAFILAPTDPAAARALLEDALATLPPPPPPPPRPAPPPAAARSTPTEGDSVGSPLGGPPGGDADDPQARFEIAVAFAAVDPGRAVAVARQIPPGAGRGVHESPDALRRIAFYLTMPPKTQTRLPFECWTWTADTRLPTETAEDL